MIITADRRTVRWRNQLRLADTASVKACGRIMAHLPVQERVMEHWTCPIHRRAQGLR